MFTPARIFLALGVAAQAIPPMAGADKIPWWLTIAFACLGIFCQAVTATTGPVQNSSQDNAVAKQAVADAKAVDGA